MLDVLAYNTHYNAIIANMLTQEMFLDSAVKRATVGLHAKRMGYLPRSMRAARAFVDIEVFPDNSPVTLTLGKYASFSSSGAISLDFINLDAITIQPNAQGKYIFQNVAIYEGSWKKFRYVVTGDHQKFTIPSKNVDTSLLKVNIQKSTTNTDITTFNYYESIVDVTSTTNAYFLRTDENGLYEVYFGDGVIGNAIETGNVVILEYLVCNGSIPNGASGFVLNDSVEGYANVSVTTTTRAFGGSEEESIDSIRDNAYIQLLSQNRAVTESDYKAIINKIIPIGDMIVWGGERNTPPVYGKVFISAIPIDINAVFDDETKKYIIEHLHGKNILTVTPEMVDPDHTYILLDTTVYYDDTKTTKTLIELSVILRDRITAYSASNLNKFNKNLRYSHLVSYIDQTDKSIVSNITKLKLRKILVPNLSISSSYSLNFKNPIKEGTITTGAFSLVDVSEYVYVDDYQGKLRIYTLVDGAKTIVRQIGTVDYAKGILKFDSMMITGYTDQQFAVTCVPASNDIITFTNDVLVMNTEDVAVNIIVEPKYKTNYVFTNSTD